MKKIVKLFLCLGMIPFLCSLTNEQKFKIVSRIVIPTAIPIQNLQCRDYDLKTLEYSVSPYGYGMLYLPVCDHLDRGECIIKENGKYVGLNPQCDSIFMFTRINASRQDTTYDAFIFFKGPKYYVVLYPCFVHIGEEAYTIGDIEIAGNDSIGCDSCVTVYLDETVPFRTDTCTSMPTYSQTHILSKRTVLRICESDMYEKMDPDSLPADHCLGVFDDSEVDDAYVDYVDVRPEFPGGKNALVSYLREGLSDNKLKIEKGTYHIVFIVDADGKVYGPRIKGKELEHLTKSELELLHLVENMPQWNPGKCEGHSVNTKETLCLKIGRKGKVLMLSK